MHRVPLMLWNRRKRCIFATLALISVAVLLCFDAPRTRLNRKQISGAKVVPFLRDGKRGNKEINFLRDVSSFLLTPAEHHRYKHLIRTTLNHLSRHKVVHFLSGGSAIGALRHGRMSPTDDDFDIYVIGSREHFEKSFLSTGTLKRSGLAKIGIPRFLKVFLADDDAVDIRFANYAWKWPFVDLFFLNQNETHIWSEHSSKHPDDMFLSRREEILPVVHTGFEGFYVPMMRCAGNVVERLFPDYLNTCCHGIWDHRRENYKRLSGPNCMPCQVLKKNFVFTKSSVISKMTCPIELENRIIKATMAQSRS